MLPSSGWRGPFGRGHDDPSADDGSDEKDQPAGHYGPSFRPGSFLPGYPAPGYAPEGLPRWSARRVERLPVRRQSIVALLGAIAMLIGSAMNWATGTAAGHPEAVRGTELDGQLSLTIAILALMFGGLLLWRTILGVCIAVALMGAGAAIIALIDMQDIRDGGRNALLPDVHLSVAPGLWLVLAAGIAVCAAGTWAARGARRV